MTEPLTPADCDLRGLPFLPLDVVRLLDSDLFALSTGDEFKAAVALWCRSWNQVPAASLPDDDRILAHLSGAGARWKKVRAMALRGWIKCNDGRLYHPVVAEKAREAWEHRQSQRARAAKRWQRDDAVSGNASAPPTAAPVADATAHAAAYPTAMQGTGTVKGEGRKEESNLPPSAAAVPAAVEQPIVELQLDAEPIDARTRLFRDGLARVRALSGKSEPQVRSLLGRWLKAAGDDASRVTRLIDQAEDLRPAEPIAWIEAGLRGRSDPFLATIRADLSGASTPAIAAETPIETMLRLERANRH